jgi:hypothetical protein
MAGSRICAGRGDAVLSDDQKKTANELLICMVCMM